MKTLEQLKEGDAIAIKYGFDYLRAKVIGNNGTHITWHSDKWLRSSSKVNSYKEMEDMNWTLIGKYKTNFLGIRKLILFNK